MPEVGIEYVDAFLPHILDSLNNLPSLALKIQSLHTLTTLAQFPTPKVGKYA